MNSVKVKNMIIGEGKPKICVSITAKTHKEITAEALRLSQMSIDMVEWRVDWFEKCCCTSSVIETLKSLSKILGDIPILFTFRTFKEGGQKVIEQEEYEEFNKTIASTGLIDILDIENSEEENAVRELVNTVHAEGVKVILSKHSFYSASNKQDIISNIKKMETLGADICKIAVMPNTKLEVLELLEAAVIASEYVNIPIITIAMGKVGTISRLVGEAFASAITFGSVGEASAPGQIFAEDLNEILELLHKNL